MGARSSKDKNRSASAQSFPTIQSRNFVGIQSKSITEDYLLDRIIGKGSNGVVRLGTNKITGTKVAIKSEEIRKSAVRNKIFKEFQILRNLDHPNVMKVFGLYQNSVKTELLFVTEYIEGGSLFDSILSSKKVMSEGKVAKIVEEVLDGLAYLHDN